MRRLFLLIGLMFLITSFCSAETIVLKSGKTIEGKIIKRTDRSIKVEVSGVPITYYLDEVASIGGKEAIVSSAEQDKTMSWEEWRASAESYMSKVNEITIRQGETSIQLSQQLANAVNQHSSPKEIDKILSNIIKALSLTIKELQALKPLEELRYFHSEILKSYKDMQSGYEAHLRRDIDTAKLLGRRGTTRMIGALEDYKRLISKYGAPKEEFDSLDKVITQFKN